MYPGTVAVCAENVSVTVSVHASVVTTTPRSNTALSVGALVTGVDVVAAGGHATVVVVTTGLLVLVVGEDDEDEDDGEPTLVVDVFAVPVAPVA